MRTTPLLTILIIAAIFTALPARAEVPLRAEVALGTGYVLAGGASRCEADRNSGGCIKIQSTGGFAIVPMVRGLAGVGDTWDVYVAASPMAVMAWKAGGGIDLEHIGFVGALDAGVALHPSSRAWTVGGGVTCAPTRMNFCNSRWCYEEWIGSYGGELHFSTLNFTPEATAGFTLSAELTARLFYFPATAFTWWSVTDPVSRFGAMLGGAAKGRF